MFKSDELRRIFLNIPISIFTKCSIVPKNPILEHNIDLNRPIIYALPFRSSLDLFIVDQQLKKLGLPSTREPLTIGNKTYPRFVFSLESVNSIDFFTDLLYQHKDKYLHLNWERANPQVLKTYIFF